MQRLERKRRPMVEKFAEINRNFETVIAENRDAAKKLCYAVENSNGQINRAVHGGDDGSKREPKAH